MKRTIILAVITFFIVIIFGLPHIVGYFKYGQRYRYLGVENTEAVTIEETYTYAPRVVELLQKKQKVVKDPYVFEKHDQPTPYTGETVPAYFMAALAIIFGSVENAFIAADFICPALIFLIIFLFIKQNTNSYFAAAAGGLTVIFLRDLVLLIPYPVAVVEYLLQVNKPIELLPYARAFHPQISFLIFFAFIIIFIRMLQSKRFLLIFSAGIFFASLFYTYLFYWTTAAFFLGLIFLFFLIKREKKQYIKTIIVVLIGFLFAVPYLINLAAFRRLPEALSFFEKSSYISKTLFFIPSLRFLIFSLLIIFFKKKKNIVDIVFVLVMFAASILPNLPIWLLGRDLEGIHWVRRLLLPISTIYLIILFSQIQHKIITSVFILLIFWSLFFGLIKQEKVTAKYSGYQWNQEDRILFKYLNSDLPKNSVIGSLNMNLNLTIPALTSHYVYLPPTIMTISSPREVLERYLFLNKQFRINLNTSLVNLKKEYGYTVYYFLWQTDKNKIEKEILNMHGYYPPFKEYKLDYLLINTQTEGKIILNKKLVFANNKYLVYKY